MKKLKVILLSLLTLITGCNDAKRGIEKAGTLVTSSRSSSLKVEISFKKTKYDFSAKGFVVGNKNNQINVEYVIEDKEWEINSEFEIPVEDSKAPDRYTVVLLKELDCSKLHPSYTEGYSAFFIRLYNDYDKVNLGLYALHVTNKAPTVNNIAENFEKNSIKLTQTD